MALKFPKSEKYNFNRNLVKRHKLVPYLDRYLGDEVKDFTFTYEPKQHDDAWHPSGHCTPPVSELYEVATGDHTPKDWGVSMLKTFMVGHFWHQLLQKAVVDLGLAAPDAIERKGKKGWGPLVIGPKLTDVEADYRPYHWATGAGDVAPLVLPTHGEYVVDFKTMSGHQFKGFESSGQLPDWAKDKYEAQINIYMDFFDLEKALIVGACKDSPHNFAEAEYRRNQPLVDAIYDKWEFVSELVDAGERPTVLDDEEFSLDNLYTGPVAQ
jgi:hypothetical protein